MLDYSDKFSRKYRWKYRIAGEVKPGTVPAETWQIPTGKRPEPSSPSDYVRLLCRFIEYGLLRRPGEGFLRELRVQKEKFVCNARDVVLLLFYLGENCVEATPDGGFAVLEVCREETDNCQGTPELNFRFRVRGPGFSDCILAVLGGPFVKTRDGSPSGRLFLISVFARVVQ